jgi:putative copper export protein
MTRKRGIFVATSLATLIGLLILLPQTSTAQAAGMPAVGTSNIGESLIETNFGTDEVHYFVLRKENNYILCYQQLVMKPKSMRYDPWKRECLAVQ